MLEVMAMWSIIIMMMGMDIREIIVNKYKYDVSMFHYSTK